MTFRVDIENWEGLIKAQVTNKGRLINELLASWLNSRNIDESDADRDPAGDRTDDVRP